MRPVSVSLLSLLCACGSTALQLSLQGEKPVEVEVIPYCIKDTDEGETMVSTFRGDQPRLFFQKTVTLDVDKLFKNKYAMGEDFAVEMDTDYIESSPQMESILGESSDVMKFVNDHAGTQREAELDIKPVLSYALLIDNKIAMWDGYGNLYSDDIGGKIDRKSYQSVIALLRTEGINPQLPDEPQLHTVELFRLSVRGGGFTRVADKKTLKVATVPTKSYQAGKLVNRVMNPARSEAFQDLISTYSQLIQPGVFPTLPVLVLKVNGKLTQSPVLVYNLNLRPGKLHAAYFSLEDTTFENLLKSNPVLEALKDINYQSAIST
uniref:Uncharacterized protein n=1 Tax=Chromera velia CCMP2878 TaxID=1169474 RepID=A0A0G4F4S7_9ALVE|eukprot:Cvel_15036.t1-p1 / transcript=Cvel_15036.t1 / gene=Cvel_15036 / organism=Chromera_velia_CCMP2878 / gene_product=hypothetical protein / transcript_product=hypothetical protein / location=Cvel_scaffold1094:55119-56078(+) / protein_length=320 / sequence_SO=supercontig / SO=protein_coding / is_pseudo=false